MRGGEKFEVSGNYDYIALVFRKGRQKFRRPESQTKALKVLTARVRDCCFFRDKTVMIMQKTSGFLIALALFIRLDGKWLLHFSSL